MSNIMRPVAMSVEARKVKDRPYIILKTAICGPEMVLFKIV